MSVLALVTTAVMTSLFQSFKFQKYKHYISVVCKSSMLLLLNHSRPRKLWCLNNEELLHISKEVPFLLFILCVINITLTSISYVAYYTLYITPVIEFCVPGKRLATSQVSSLQRQFQGNMNSKCRSRSEGSKALEF